MTLFRFMWLRRFIRKHTREIPYTTADTWKKRLSIVYMLIGWNAFGIVCYCVYQGKGDWARYYNLKSEEELRLTPAQQWAKTLNIKKATVYTIKGTNIHQYEIDEENEAEDLPQK